MAALTAAGASGCLAASGKPPPAAIAGLPSTDLEIVRYALRLTHTPAAIGAGDIDRLRSVGLDDRAVHDLCSIVAYFAFVNRIADGLGVELEEPLAES